MNTVNLLSVEAGAIIWIVVIVLLLVVMFVMPIFTNKKRQKEMNEMLDAISVGDEIMTLGGVMGKVVALRTHESGEKLMVIETGEGDHKMTMTFTTQAMRLNYTKTKLRQEQLAKEKAEKEKKQIGKSEGGKEKKDDFEKMKEVSEEEAEFKPDQEEGGEKNDNENK